MPPCHLGFQSIAVSDLHAFVLLNNRLSTSPANHILKELLHAFVLLWFCDLVPQWHCASNIFVFLLPGICAFEPPCLDILAPPRPKSHYLCAIMLPCYHTSAPQDFYTSRSLNLQSFSPRVSDQMCFQVSALLSSCTSLPPLLPALVPLMFCFSALPGLCASTPQNLGAHAHTCLCLHIFLSSCLSVFASSACHATSPPCKNVPALQNF